jgi:hypothetical protein
VSLALSKVIKHLRCYIRGSPHAAGGGSEVDSSSSTILKRRSCVVLRRFIRHRAKKQEKSEVDDEIRGTARRSTISYVRTFFKGIGKPAKNPLVDRCGERWPTRTLVARLARVWNNIPYPGYTIYILDGNPNIAPSTRHLENV